LNAVRAKLFARHKQSKQTKMDFNRRSEEGVPSEHPLFVLEDQAGPVYLYPDDTVEDLQRGGLRLLQKKNGFRFGTDSVILAAYASTFFAHTPEKDLLVADLGAGCGAVALLLAARLPRARIWGVELEETSCSTFARNILLNHLENRMQAVRLDVRQIAAGRAAVEAGRATAQAASQADAAYALEVAEYVETLFYRFVMYPLSGQALSQGLPLRSITRDRFYDQLVHAYENIPAYALCPDIGGLKGLFRGETAIVAAAGASLAGQYEYLRENQDRAVIIAVNSALKTLVDAGIRPHFCVVNDTSLQVAKSFEGLPLLRPVMLVAHSLSHLGGDVFPQKFLFGQMRTDVFGPRPSLRLHGSVLTTALALARYLGCERAVLAGALLSSGDPWSLSYVTGSTGRGYEPESRERIDRFPQLYPLTNRFGRQRYTSLNFLDVKHWLGDELRQGGMEVVNTSKDSILDIPPVRFDEAPAIEPTGRLAQSLRTAHTAHRRAPALNAALGYARDEYARHKVCLDMLDSLEGLDDPAFLVQGSRVLAVFDSNNVTYLLQRYEDFSHTLFYAWITSPDPAELLRGLRYQFAYARRMLTSLLELLQAQEQRLLQLGATR